MDLCLLDPHVAHTHDAIEQAARRLSLSDIVEREQASGNAFGPMHRLWQMERAPEKVKRMLERAKARPDLVAARQGFASMDVNDFPPSNFTAVTANATETNLWAPALWTPIPAFDPKPGKVYKLSFGGIFTSTGTQGVITWTPRYGQSNTPASNVTLGASNATAPPASLTGAAFYGEFTLGFRSLGVAASGATATGNGFVIVQGAAAATAIMYAMGGAIPTTLDHTTAQGLAMSLTISVASQSYTAEWCVLRSYN